MKNPRNLLWLIPLLLLLTSPFWKPALSAFLQPRGDYEGDETIRAEAEGRRFILEGITITLTNEGHPQWRISAERAYTGQSDLEIGMSAVHAVYTSDNHEKTTITSERGTYRVDERHLILIDQVLVKKPATRQQLSTDLLHYYDPTKMVVCPIKTIIKSPDFTITAGRLDYDLANNGYDLSNGVLCEF